MSINFFPIKFNKSKLVGVSLTKDLDFPLGKISLLKIVWSK